MKKTMLLLSIFSFTFAQESLEELKRQLEEQRRQIRELEKKIEALEKQKSEAKEEVKEEQKPAPADRSLQLKSKYDERLKALQIIPTSQRSFLNLSLIVDTSFVARNKNDQEFKRLEIPGLYHRHEGNGHGHGTLNEKRGFNLNYAELYLYAPVDPYFDLYATIPFSEDGSEVEEAYAVTRGLPFGFQFKVGKFRSSFGRLNAQHPHVWDFANQPLVYKVFLGDDGLKEKGVQLNWLAPTPFYLLFGVEVLQGENEQSFGTEGFKVNTKKDGSGTDITVGDTKKPNLYVGFVKTSFDVGNLSVLTGLSFATGHSRINHLEGDDPHAFAGKTQLYGFDLTAKYFLDSYRYISFQGEYLYRDQKGTRYGYNNAGDLRTAELKKEQGGFYTQLVFKFDKRWRAGFQYSLINKNDVKRNGVKRNLPDNLPAYYAMLEYSPTEFSRIRFQVGQNRAFFHDGSRKTVNEVILQFNFAIGAHGAHPF
ncbi:hypothetical protein [Thermocrinis sp.]|jgi:hypothetical protein|uniref:hypothetical protein n=1 Tax=Thermocrinis sp. TaxID=2024383 RepID=UPI00261749B8|nr:hypothetical protein [Thermocrinis sp.]